MSVFEVVSAIILILACVFIVIVVLLKDTKTQMSQSISGTSSDSYYQKNAGRTKEAMLNKATIVAVVLFFVLAVAVNLINVYGKKASADQNSGTATVTSSEVSSDATSSETTSSDTSDTSDTSSTSSDSSTVSSDTSANSSAASGTESAVSSTASE